MDKPTYTATREILESLAFKGENKAWTATMRIMDTFIELEVANAIRANQSDAERAHACGRADAIVDMKNHLLEMRSQARKEFNIPDSE
jgi:hypothetical protein